MARLSAGTDVARGSRLPPTFIALQHRNYRLWFIGQSLSLMGTWMQNVAQGWLVYDLTGSKLALGTISFIGTIPTLFLMLPAGALADRIPRRTLLLITQSFMMVPAFALAILAGTHMLQVWHIAVLAFVLGVATSFDAPARQSLAVDMVEDRAHLMNAIALNSTIFNLARVLGPAIGGAILAVAGPAWCFGLNGVSFLAVIGGLLMMRFPSLPQRGAHEPLMRQIGVGLRYVRGHKEIRSVIALLGVSSLFGMGYGTLMPAFAVDVLRVGQAGLGALNAAAGLGALVGSLTVATFGASRHKGTLLTVGSLLFPLAAIGFAFSRSFPLSLAALALVGWALVTQNATCNTLVQAAVPDDLRGRVMGAYMLVFFGSTPFGSLISGSVAQALGPSLGVSLGAAVSFAFAVFVLLAVPRVRRFEA